MNKVYCSQCKYIVLASNCECYHPSNLREDSNWLQIQRIPICQPQEINRNNNCAGFETIGVTSE